MEWYSTWTQAYSAFATRNDYASAIAQLKQLEENPVCKNNLVSVHSTLDAQPFVLPKKHLKLNKLRIETCLKVLYP